MYHIDPNLGADSMLADTTVEYITTKPKHRLPHTPEMQMQYHTRRGGSPKQVDPQAIPLYDIEAAAGLTALFAGNKQNVIDTIKIPNLPNCDGALAITGDSMYPLLKSGDIVLFKQVLSRDYILYGEMYLISYNILGDEYLVVKYMQRSEREGHVRLVSYNQHHTPIDIPEHSITALALVKASVRFCTM